MRSVDIVIPAYNEAASLSALARRILEVMAPLQAVMGSTAP